MLSGEKESYIGGYIILIVNLIKVHIFFIFLFFCSIHQINKFQNITILKIFLFKQIFLFFQYNDHILINNETHLPDLLSSKVSRYVVSQDRLPL